MIRIKDIAALEHLVQKYFIRRTITNNYFLPDAYRRYIAEDRLFYATTESNACIFLCKPGFSQMYYYINDFNELIEINTGEPVVMEILYRGETQYPNAVLDYWEKCGFNRHLTRDNMAASFDKIVLPESVNPRIEIKIAKSQREIKFTKDLFEQTLDRYTGDLLSYDEIKKYTNNNNLICAYTEGNLCGALQFEIKNNIVWLGHIAVDEVYRGKGIANALVNSYITNNILQPDTKYHLWVISDNLAAKTLYHKFGFVYTNKSTVSMLKLTKESKDQ